MIDLERLTTTVESFCRFMEQLPGAARQEQPWGPREVLAHLVYWHELYVEQVEALRGGPPAELPEGRFSDLNALAVAQSRGAPLDEMLRRFREANERLVIAITASPDLAIQLKRGSKVWPLEALIPNVGSHIRNHLKLLKKAQKSQNWRLSTAYDRSRI
jgi:hypothetical protein